MNKKQSRTLGILLIFLGLLIIFHHLIVAGRLFDLKDALHHEFFEAILFATGLTLLLVSRFHKE